jgi:TPR repeat protein
MNQKQLIQKMEEELEDIKAETYYEYAKQGCAEAMFLLGTSYYTFDNIEPVEWLQRAIDQGHAKAWYALGCQYSIPKFAGGLEDDEKEFMCYHKAAELGVAEAYYELGVHYNQGWKVERDEKKAFEYFMKAAEMNLPEALNVLTYIYKKGNSVVEKDLEKALEYAEMAYIEKE